MKVGAGRATIALDDILPFDGFGEVHDDLHARAAVFEAGERACVVSLEVTSLKPNMVALLRKEASTAAACPEENVWICVTHTFSAPHVRTPEHLDSSAEVEKNERLVEAYAAAVRQAASMAVASVVEARLQVASGPMSINVNRDVKTPAGWWLGSNPEGFSNREVRALVALRSQDESPLCVLFSADVQSSVLDRSTTSDGRRVVSGDLAGRAATYVEQGFSGCVALFVVGCAGDQAPVKQAVTQEVTPSGEVVRHDVHEAGFEMVERLGRQLGNELVSALVGAYDLSGDAVASTSHRLVCPGQGRADFSGLSPHASYAYLPAEPVTTMVSVLSIGELVLVGVEPELSSLLGSRLRHEATGPMDVLTMVNGGAKYLPDAGAYDKITYEAMNSGFAKGSDEVLAQDVLASVAAARREMQL